MLVLIALLGIPSFVMLVAIYAMKPHVDACQQVWARPLEGGATAPTLRVCPELNRAVFFRSSLEHRVLPNARVSMKSRQSCANSTIAK